MIKKNKLDKSKIDLNKLEDVVIKIILTSAILIIVGIVVSVYQKGLAFWMTSIGSGILFFSIFGLMVLIFLKEFKTNK